jgi:hypothetical protein
MKPVRRTLQGRGGGLPAEVAAEGEQVKIGKPQDSTAGLKNAQPLRTVGIKAARVPETALPLSGETAKWLRPAGEVVQVETDPCLSPGCVP